MNRRSLLIRTGVIAGALGGGWWLKEHILWRAPDLVFTAGPTTPWIDFSARVISPTIPVRIAGQTVNALIDSGAQYSVIDEGFHAAIEAGLGPRPLFDIPLVAYGVGGQPQMGKGVRLDIGVDGLSLSGLRCAILDLGPLADDEGLSAPLILGQDLLKLLALEVDLVDRRMRLLDRAAVVHDARWSRVAVRRRGTALVTPVEVEGHTLDAVVDTGASSILSLSQPAAEAAGILDGRPAGTGESLVLGGQITADILTVARLRAVGRTFREVDVPVYGAVGMPGIPEALLGMAAFRDQGLLLDIGGGALYRSAQLDLTVVQ
ncbi:aspartyl protease family protein [Brevundimonas sp.]|uniref:aspartyl protease family protein n=1 Tax=Brevundimonas sp. TaxID=1871086 RepID=UPI003AF62B00